MTGKIKAEMENPNEYPEQEMTELGHAIAQMNDVNAIDKLATRFLDFGLADEAVRILDEKDSAVEYMRQAIEEITGWHVNYNDNVQQWINADNGQFMGKVAFNINMTTANYEQAIIDKFGMNPE